MGFELKVEIDPNCLGPGYVLVGGRRPTRIRLLVGGGVGTTRSIKGGAERATDQRAHELPSPKSRAREFRKRGGARKGFAEPKEWLRSVRSL